MGIGTFIFLIAAATALTLFGAGFVLQVSFCVAKTLPIRLVPLAGGTAWAIFLIIKAETAYFVIFSVPFILGISAALLKDFLKRRKEKLL